MIGRNKATIYAYTDQTYDITWYRTYLFSVIVFWNLSVVSHFFQHIGNLSTPVSTNKLPVDWMISKLYYG